MLKSTDQKPLRFPGLVLHSAALYDLMVWLFTFGRERAFREKMLRLARLQLGEVVLDVGCGTGTLAIIAGQQVGTAGVIYGIDASPSMIVRAASKAKREGISVRFKVGAAQALPFPDAHMDVVLTTLMLHHLPRTSRQQLAGEVRRVLKPGGRVLAVDFGPSARGRKRLLSRLHRPHGHTKLEDIVALLSEAGFSIVESGAVGTKNLHFVRATVPGEAKPANRSIEHNEPMILNRSDTRSGLGRRAGVYGLGVAIALIALAAALLHVGVGTSFFAKAVDLSQLTALGFLGLAGLVLLKVIVKAGFIIGWRFKRRAGLEK